jgi:hypothetical protein
MSSPSLRVFLPGQEHPGEDPREQEGYDAGDDAKYAMEVSDSDDSDSDSYSSEEDDSCIGATGIQGVDKITRAAAKALAKTYLPQLQEMISELGDTSGAVLIKRFENDGQDHSEFTDVTCLSSHGLYMHKITGTVVHGTHRLLVCARACGVHQLHQTDRVVRLAAPGGFLTAHRDAMLQSARIDTWDGLGQKLADDLGPDASFGDGKLGASVVDGADADPLLSVVRATREANPGMGVEKLVAEIKRANPAITVGTKEVRMEARAEDATNWCCYSAITECHHQCVLSPCRW